MKRIFLFSVITTLPLWAVWQNPTPICTAAGTQDSFLVLPYDNGGVLVLWEDSRNGNTDIYAQALDADGNALWQKDGIPVVVQPGNQTQLDAVVLESGDVGVIWDDGRVSGQHSVYAQRLTPNGSLKWGTGGVSIISTQIDLTYPHLCQSNDGTIVEWTQGGTYPRFIKTKRLLATGQVIWADTGKTICDADVGFGDMTPALHGSIIISYEDDFWKDGQVTREFRAQRLDSLGAFLWGDSGILLYTVKPTYALFSKPLLGGFDIQDDSGGAIIQWWTIGQQHAQRVDSAGTLLWGDTGIVVSPPVNSSSLLKSGGMFLVRSSIEDHESVYAHRLTIDGKTPWVSSGSEIWSIWAYAPQGAIYPYVTEDGIVTWRDVYDSGDPYGNRYEERGILSQRVDENGKVLWPNEILVCGTTGSNPRIVSTNHKGGIIVWQDNRKGNLDLYATRIDSLGNLPPGIEEPVFPKKETVIEVVGLSQIKVYFASSSEISLDVFDVAGCKVITVQPRKVEPGAHSFKLDSYNLASGVYLVRINIKDQERETQWAKITIAK